MTTQTTALAAIFLSTSLLACRSTPSAANLRSELPGRITECETNTARVCGVWQLIPGTNTYSATWMNGSKAVITVIQFDDRAVIFSRRDTAGPTKDMEARYAATAVENSVTYGQVRWSTGGVTFYGRWDAQW